MDVENCLPRFVVVKDAKQADNIVAKEMIA
jgi:hypothetical protein